MIPLHDREINKRTAETFDWASGDFDSARPGPWPSIDEMGSLSGKRILDLGAGTGRNSDHFLQGGASVVAVDVSLGMLRVLGRKTGAEKPIHLLRCDATSLPFRDGSFDGVAFIAALHHLPDHKGRRRALGEVERVTAHGGVVLITVWAPPELPKGAKILASCGGTDRDILVPWAGRGGRFYHIFSPSELRTLLSEAGLTLTKVFHERVSKRALGTNLVAVATK